MTLALVVVAAIAVGLLVLFVLARQKVSALSAERDRQAHQLDELSGSLADAKQRTERVIADLGESESKRSGLSDELAALQRKHDDTAEALRKRTELADTQAMQIDSLSGERDDLRQQLTATEEQIVTLAARPGMVVGDLTSADGASTEMLWDLELARSERAWRNSVAINPVADESPFEGTNDPVQLAVEIEAAALREDVGAHISIDWQAAPISSPARRLLVVRVAQEMLSSAARAPGAARLVVTQVGEGDGEIKFEFQHDDETVINLIPPQISHDLIDIRNEGLSVTVKAE